MNLQDARCNIKENKIVAFDEVYILFHFNIIPKHNGMSCTKLTSEANTSQDFQETPAFYENRCSLPTLQKLLPSPNPEPDELNL